MLSTLMSLQIVVFSDI